MHLVLVLALACTSAVNALPLVFNKAGQSRKVCVRVCVCVRVTEGERERTGTQTQTHKHKHSHTRAAESKQSHASWVSRAVLLALDASKVQAQSDWTCDPLDPSVCLFPFPNNFFRDEQTKCVCCVCACACLCLCVCVCLCACFCVFKRELSLMSAVRMWRCQDAEFDFGRHSAVPHKPEHRPT